MVAWVILATWPTCSFGQDNPLRSIEAERANAREKKVANAPGNAPASDVANSADQFANQERQLAERIASICSQQFGPWMQWFTLVSQAPTPSEVAASEEPSDSIIEIPDVAMEASTPPANNDAAKAVEETSGTAAELLCEGTDYDTEPVSESQPPSRIVIGDTADEILVETSIEPIEAEDSPSQQTIAKESPGKSVSGLKNLSVPEASSSNSKEPSSRNMRTPRSLLEAESVDAEKSTAPRALSESMKSKSEDIAAKRSIKSADEDMRDYLAQEEPSPDSVRNSINDQMQGVDADRAIKPDTSNSTEDGVRSPSKRQVITDKPRSNVPAPMQQRLARVESCLDHYLRNPETTTARSPWAVMHAILAYGAEYELIGPNGRVNAIGWMCHNGLCRTQRIFTPRGDFFVPNVGGGVQGHEGQFLAILAQCQVPLDYPIQIGSKKFKVEDLVRYEMATCKEKSELTFKLIGLSYYVDADKQWRSNDGKVWNIEKLLREELAQPVVGSACGGTHRLMGLSFCLRQRELQGLPINGQFARAAQFINEYVRYTWQIQNPDGSFSTNWYAGRGNEPNDERKVQTSGHMLEWLMFTVSDEEMTSPRVEKAVDFLLSKIYDRRDFKWPIGPRGHATRALALYHLRIEALLEQRSGGPATLAEERVQEEDPAKVARSATPAPVIRQGQVSPGGRPTSQPASRSTGRPNRRVRS
jgi:hypothetical protein